MKITINGVSKNVLLNASDTIEEVQKKICAEPIYMFVRQRRYVSSRQIYQSPNMRITLLNLGLKCNPSTYFDLLELELDGERDVLTPLGVNLPDNVPVNPVYFEGSKGVAVKERRTLGEYMPYDELYAYTEDRLPSDVYVPVSDTVEPKRRPNGYWPSCSNLDLQLAQLASKATRFGECEYSNRAIHFKEAVFHEDGSMVVPEWTPTAQLLVERMNRLVQFGEACKRTVYDRPTFIRGGVDWVETFEELPVKKGVPFRHVDVTLRYQRQRVAPHMSPFLACVAAMMGVAVGSLKERLLRRIKRNTFPFCYRGALLRYFGTIQTPAYEDFLNYVKSDDRIDYTFMWEYVARPGLFPKGANLLIYDADRQVLIFPTKDFSEVGYQEGAPTLSIVKEGDFFFPMTASTPLKVKEWYEAAPYHATLDKKMWQVVYEGKVVGAHGKCLVPCKPTEADGWELVDYKDVRKMPPKDTVDYLIKVGAKPRYSYVVGRCVGVWTEGMHFVPCEEGDAVLPLPEIEAVREFIHLKGVDAARLERSRQRWMERRQYNAYKASKCDYVVVDECAVSTLYFQKKLVMTRKVEARLKEEELCYL